MPETRRSKRNTDSEETAPRLRLTMATDALHSPNQYGHDLYTPHQLASARSAMPRARRTGLNVATSSNAMDLDLSPHGLRGGFYSDEESGSDSEMHHSYAAGASREGHVRRKYTRRPSEAGKSAGPEHESMNKVLRNREAAQQFRQRQREHMLVLQQEHERLTEENRAFQEHMNRLRVQKEEMDRDLVYARTFLEHTMSIAMANLRHSNRLDLLEPVAARA